MGALTMRSPILTLFLGLFPCLIASRNLSNVIGVAGAGWLHLEDWMFSWPMDSGLPPTDYEYSLVDTQRGSPQGRLFPSALMADHNFSAANNYSSVQPWYSEGDLVTESINRFGALATVGAFIAHRNRYWSEEDL